MFDKNFKIKVAGNWCEYQPNKHIDLREIISFECWADQLGSPYRFHLKNGSHHYIERYEVGKQIENVLKEQQAKVEGLKASHHCEMIGHEVHLKKIKQERDELQTLYTQQGINMFKLQKRVDKALELMQKPVIVGEPAKYVCARFKEIEQVLKGGES